MYIPEKAEDDRAIVPGIACGCQCRLCAVKADDHVTAAHAMSGSCRYIIETIPPCHGVEVLIVDGHIRETWKERSNQTAGLSFLKHGPIPLLKSLILRRQANLPARLAQQLPWTMFLQPCLSRSRLSREQTRLSIPPPGILTARAAALAALSFPARSG